ncbi:phage adaptor protein [Lysinibacillus sp. BSL11]
MLTLQQIIKEADVRVPNPFDVAQKISWLNEINVEFFEIVRIPKVWRFVIVAGTDTYEMPPVIKSYAIENVRNQSVMYESIQYEKVQPGRNYWSLDDDTKKLTLFPRPTLGVEAIVSYRKKAESTYLVSELSATLDAPSEFHWTYILALCERIAKAMNDVPLANNYANDYRGQLSVAQESYKNRSEGGGGSA